MKELVEVIAKSLVDNPEEVTVTETEKDRATVLELSRGKKSYRRDRTVKRRQGTWC